MLVVFLWRSRLQKISECQAKARCCCCRRRNGWGTASEPEKPLCFRLQSRIMRKFFSSERMSFLSCRIASFARRYVEWAPAQQTQLSCTAAAAAAAHHRRRSRTVESAACYCEIGSSCSCVSVCPSVCTSERASANNNWMAALGADKRTHEHASMG